MKIQRYCVGCGDWLPDIRKDKYCSTCRQDIEIKHGKYAEKVAAFTSLREEDVSLREEKSGTLAEPQEDKEGKHAIQTDSMPRM